MKNYSLMILLWIASTTFAISNGDNPNANSSETPVVLSSKKVKPTDDVRFEAIAGSTSILITNAAPIKEMRVYDNHGRLIDTYKYLSEEYSYDTSALPIGKYAFNIQVADHVVPYIYEKK